MTKNDLRIALICAALVVVLGMAIGFGVGVLTQPQTGLFDRPAAGAEIGLSQDGQDETINPDGGKLPGYQGIYVNDYQDLLDTEAKRDLRKTLSDLRVRTGIEMTVLTISDMQTYGHTGAIEPFATALFNAWGIGNATRNDGVLILVSRFDRQMRIELGAGYSGDFDARMQQVIDDTFLPAFRQDQYQRGIVQGVNETIRDLTGAYPGQLDQGTIRQGWSWLAYQARKMGAWLLALVAVPLGGIFLLGRRYLRLRPRRCSRCPAVMQRLGETSEDEHLDGGQQLEEFLKSVDYDVWQCPDCDHMEIKRYKKWVTNHGACPQCNYHTLSTNTVILHAATTSVQGSKRMTYTCKNCDYTKTEVRSIPRISKSSSSGGSSFGGGSSSGGGASGSW